MPGLALKVFWLVGPGSIPNRPRNYFRGLNKKNRAFECTMVISAGSRKLRFGGLLYIVAIDLQGGTLRTSKSYAAWNILYDTSGKEP